MADKPGAKSVAFNIIDTWKAKRPSVLPLLPPEFFAEIGRVAHVWGLFDTLFDNFLAALVKANGVTIDYRGMNFRKRRKLMRDELPNAFPDLPPVVAYVEKILDDIEALYVKRNLIVHGQHAAEIGPHPTRLVSRGRYKGKDITEKFSAEELDDLYYEIAHLAGRLNEVSSGYVEPPLSSHDRSKLQAFLASNHPTYPIPSRLPPQP